MQNRGKAILPRPGKTNRERMIHLSQVDGDVILSRFHSLIHQSRV